ncbi:MAG: hypothetical protein U0931_34985 [Vulcanimicrobiota bacterium]
MQIRNFNSTTPSKLPVRSNQSQGPGPGPQDRSSINWDRVGNSAILVGSSVIPVIGAGTNAMSAWATAWDDSSRNGSGIRPAIGLGGAVANVAGTLVGAYGLLSGNHTASMVGLGLLGASGVASATMVALTP